MAIQPSILYTETSRAALPRYTATRSGSLTFAAAAGAAETLPIGTPVFVDAATGFVRKIIPGSVTAQETEVHAIIITEPVLLKATGGGEVLGVCMLAGQINYDDIRAIQVAAVLAGTEAQLKTALRKSITRERGIFIEGLDLMGGP